jgi:DNA-binding transcriptional ArsR family regulator
MESARLNSTFAALADPTRRAILGLLANGELTVKDIAKPFPLSAPAITKHLKVLERAGLITRSRSAQRRPCRLNGVALRDAASWLDAYRRHWDERLDRLDDYLREFQGHSPLAKRKAHD